MPLVADRAIASARSELRFVVYSFASDSLVEGILAKLRSGVNVKMIVNVNFVRSNRERPEQLQPLFRLLDRGERGAGLLQVKLYKQPGGNFASLHPSLIIVDDVLTVSGSFNFSTHSFTKNREVMTVLYDRFLLDQMKHFFEELWADDESRSELFTAERARAFYDDDEGRSGRAAGSSRSRQNAWMA